MNWKQKARARRLLASAPGGGRLYRFLQRRYGRLRHVSPWRRMKWSRDLVSVTEGTGVSLADWRMVEIGTGWMPVAPIFFWLGGATSVDALDIERNLNDGIAERVIGQMIADGRSAKSYFEGLSAVDLEAVESRLERLAGMAGLGVDAIFDGMKVRYHAPMKMSLEGAPEGQFDCIYSMGVLEHLSKDELAENLEESRRMLAPGGYVLHGVNCADHSFHDEEALSTINFVQCSENEWNGIAGNRFMFHNRLRAIEYLELLESHGFEIVRSEQIVDEKALKLISAGFPIDESFSRFTPEEISTKGLKVLARKIG